MTLELRISDRLISC